MKKLLGLLAIAPMAITACGGSAESKGIHGVNVGSGTGMFDSLLTGGIDFAGNWGDSRDNATDDSSVYEDVIAIGVSEHRIANDGIQAAEGMSPADVTAVQAMFQAIVADDTVSVVTGKDDDDADVVEHVLDLYGHSNYKNIMNLESDKISYLNQGKIAEKDMTTVTPAAAGTEGTIFGANGKVKSGQSLDIMFIPSTDETFATAASAKLEEHIQATFSEGADNVTVTVATSYDAAATSLAQENVDLAFLPVNTWTQHAPKSNFILQAGREAQVAILDFDETGSIHEPATITNQSLTSRVMNRFSELYVQDVTKAALGEEDLSVWQEEFKASLTNKSDEFYSWANAVQAYAEEPATQMIAGSYESYIWARNGSELERRVTENYNTANLVNDWTVDVSDLSLDYGFTSTTSSSTFLFPSLWLQKHLGSTPKV